MRTKILIFLILTSVSLYAQNYNPVINYQFNGTPTNGIKIKTNIPFTNYAGMPTIIIEGFEYSKHPIGIILNWYVYSGNFSTAVASSFGDYTPEIKLYNENNKIILTTEKTRLMSFGMKDDDVNKKFKKTFKNRYFLKFK